MLLEWIHSNSVIQHTCVPATPFYCWTDSYTPIWGKMALLILVVPYGACTHTDSHCFGRLPGGLEERDSELLAIDSAGSMYRYYIKVWEFTGQFKEPLRIYHITQVAFQSRQPNSSCSVECTVSSSRSEGYKQQIMGPLCYSRYSEILGYHSLPYSIACAFSFTLGPSPNAVQDSFMYRVQNGVRSLLLDDDNCDCYSTLSMQCKIIAQVVL